MHVIYYTPKFERCGIYFIGVSRSKKRGAEILCLGVLVSVSNAARLEFFYYAWVFKS
jgi:hypothetical protein